MTREPGTPETPGASDARKAAACPLCKQYSHSLGDDQLAEAHMHFHAMTAHPVRGHPMGDAFDEKTRDAANVLLAKIEQLQAALGERS